MLQGIIYMYTSPSNKNYIGQTTNESNRRKLWKSSTYHYAGTKIDRARAKYGADNFLYTVLFRKDFSTKQIAVEWLNIAEKYYINIYDTVKNGYNCEGGGGGNPKHTKALHHVRGYKLSEETKRRIGEGARRWQNTPEGKRKMSKARKGIKHNRHSYIYKGKEVIQFSRKGEFIAEYSSISKAEKYLAQLSNTKVRGNISYVCNGKRDSAYGYKWMYKDDYEKYYLNPNQSNCPVRVQRFLNDVEKQNRPPKTNKVEKIKKRKIYKNCQAVGQYDPDYNLIKVWRNAQEAAVALNIAASNIYRSVHSLGMYKGYYWRCYEGAQKCTSKPTKKIKKPALNKKVIQLDLQGNIITTHSSIGDACSAINVNNRTLLSRCLNGKIAKAYGYKWEFLK